VLHALRDGRPTTALSAKDKRDILANLVREVLPGSADFTFTSTTLTREGAGWAVAGTLTLGRVSRPVAFRARAEGSLLVADIPLHQPDFGIKPFSAMLGALKVKPGVLVRVRVPAW
jgi:hypothetical protein